MQRSTDRPDIVVAGVPIDPKHYLLGSLLLAIPIFALLAWSAFLQPSSLVMTTLLLSLLSIGVYCYECVSIHQKDTGALTGAKCFIQSKKATASTKQNRKPLKPSQSQPQKRIRLRWISPLCAAVLSFFGVSFLHPAIGSSTITEPQFFPCVPILSAFIHRLPIYVYNNPVHPPAATI